MRKHFNLYYIFLEDKKLHPMPDEKFFEIQKNLEKFFKKVKPP